MSNINMVIEERATSIGPFLVGRLLPFRQKRAVGPFVFIDHMGPIAVKEHEKLDIEPHPHIGLSTLTYLFEGAIMHRDSIGSLAEITPGAVNWMTAGKGVVHSERMPEHIRETNPDMVMHGLQIWVALPKELQEMEPGFTHISRENIPEWEQYGVNIKLIAGEAFGKKSGVPVYSPLYFLEIKNESNETRNVNIGNDLFGESGLYILEGSIEAEGNRYEPRNILIAANSKLCHFDMAAHTTVYIFGGEPFPEERFIMWNFVSSEKERLEKAKADWITQNHEAFPLIPQDDKAFVPFPAPPAK